MSPECLAEREAIVAYLRRCSARLTDDGARLLARGHDREAYAKATAAMELVDAARAIELGTHTKGIEG